MIYGDAAATTFQKPRMVREAVRTALETMSSPGRGNYASAALAADTLFSCREELAEMFGVENPEQVVFTFNATHALNLAISSLVGEGAEVVISGYEHNAVTRPLHAIKNVRIRTAAAPLFDQQAMIQAFSRQITPNADAVICTHVSNVFGYILPIEAIAALCRERRVPLIVDASQSAGCLEVDQRLLQADFIAMPGHKGLYGPQGTGVLLCGQQGKPLLYGGTGSLSRDQAMPDFLPDRLEAGTHNVPGIAGLLAGVRFVRSVGIREIRHHSYRLKEQLLAALDGLKGFRALGTHAYTAQAGLLSFLPETGDPEMLCEALSQRGIALRGGYHCAPLAHQSAGTIDSGTARFSVSVFNREDEVNRLIGELKKFTV